MCPIARPIHPERRRSILLAGLLVLGPLSLSAPSTFTVDATGDGPDFANAACDPTDHGEGETLRGSVMVTSGFSPCVRVNAAATFVVTSTDDDDDGVCGAGHCTLREAINAANALAGTDAIHFDIPGTGPHTIQPGAPTFQLPEVTDPVVIDGYTQPGASPNTNAPDEGTNAVWMVEIDASNTNGVGLDISAGNSTVRGLSITNAGDWAIRLFTNDGNTIEGNSLTDGFSYGVYVLSSDNTIGGTAPAARNVIGGGNDGIRLDIGRNNVVQGNLIGTDATGTVAHGNSVYGIALFANANTIGGATPGAGNVISANGYGIYDSGGDSVVIRGNLIGTDVTGTAAIGNTDDGMFLSDGMYATVADNVVSGNGGLGIYVSPDSLALTGNYVGVDITGTAALPNAGSGIAIAGLGVVVGGTEEGAGNLIAFNGAHGVTTPFGGTAAVLGNTIHSNVGLGIDWGDDGVTPNDAGDADDLQNFPALDFALTGSAELEGTFSGAANATLRLEFFSTDECDGSGYGEGRRFLGFTTVTTDGSGDATFAASLAGPASPGDAVTATATDEDGHTSEFSACVTGVGYDVAAAATEGTVIRGQDASYDVTVSAVAGAFDRDVTLSCAGLPAGASCAFTPATVQPGATSAMSDLVVSTAEPATPTGANEFSVVATHGAIERTAASTVTVTDFAVAASPETVSVTGGQSATFTVTVSPDGPSFGEAVSLACSGLPSGASCSFAPSEVTPGSGPAASMLTLSTAPLGAEAWGAPGGGSPWSDGLPWGSLALLAALVALAALVRRPERMGKVAAAVAVVLIVGLASACKGDPSGPGPNAVTTTFTITGTSGGLERTTDATVTVR